MNTFHADMLALSVTPGILVSACGVISTALYNRMGVILARIRSYHQKKIEILSSHDPHRVVYPESLLNMIDAQIVAVTAKAKMIQKGLYSLLSAIIAFLLCSIFAGIAIVYEWFGIVAIASGLVAVCLFIRGLRWAVREVTCAISPLEEEATYLQSLRSQYSSKPEEKIKLRIAE
jgi:hypothetical protein